MVNPIEIQSFDQMIAFFVWVAEAILALFLIGAFYEMRRLLRTQTELMRTQTRLLAVIAKETEPVERS